MERRWTRTIIGIGVSITVLISMYFLFDYLIVTFGVGTQELASLGITIFFALLFGLFVWQSIQRKRYATALVISLFFGVLGGVFAIMSSGFI